jgi:MFS family permease
MSFLPGVLYFGLVFGTGFVLGPVRVLWLAPRVGERWAELIELSLMIVVIVLAARFVVRRLAVPPTVPARLGMGLLALALVLAAEFSLVLWLRGMTLGDYFAGRDPVAGTAYYLTLAFFAALPLLLARRR